MNPIRPDSLDLAALFDEHQRRLLGLTLRITGDFALAEDALQQTFLKAHASRATFRGDSSPGTWLYRIAIREAVALRKARRARHSADASAASIGEQALNASDDPARSPQWREATLRLLKALDELPEEQRMAIILLSIRELSAHVAGEILGVAPATVYTRAFRARLWLQDRLGPK